MIALARTFIFALLLMLCLGSAAHADEAEELQAGIDAYRAKNFQATIEKVLPLAIKGNAEAQYIISIMYADGKGFPKNQCASVIWVEKAARQGHAYAAVAMAYAYSGIGGIKRNDELAYRWMAYGNKQGHPDVLEDMDFLARYITAEKRAEIDEDIKTWDPSILPAPEFFPISRKIFKPAEFTVLLRQTYGITACSN